MKQKDLCNKIGMADRSFRRLSPAKRQQWQALADKGKTITWFDIVELLTFEVEAFNSVKPNGENIGLTFDGHGAACYHMDSIFETIHHTWIRDIDQLTEALQYVQSLNK